MHLTLFPKLNPSFEARQHSFSSGYWCTNEMLCLAPLFPSITVKGYTSSTPREAVSIDPFQFFLALGTVFLDGPLFGMKLTSSKSLKDAYQPLGHPYTCICFCWSTDWSLFIVRAREFPIKNKDAIILLFIFIF